MKTLMFALTLLSANAFAWGPTGHRVVGQVAERHLTVDVHYKIFQMLGGQSLARVANWPDEIKSEPQTYSHTYNWHYTDWADEMHNHDESNSSGKLITSLREQIAVLKDPAAAQEKKVFAIKFITHLIGDLHQPLHVGNGVDRGGNYCKVVFQGQQMNLHALWDEGMIDFTKLSFTELAQFVSQGRSTDNIAAWKKGDLLDWAQESKSLRNEVYPDEVHRSSEPTAMKQYCKKEATSEEIPKIGYEYSYKFVPVMEQRLFQAGIRLAAVLNDALK